MLAQRLHKCLISQMQASRTAEVIYTKGGTAQVMGSHPSQKLPQQQLKDTSFGSESLGKERLLPAQTAYNKKPQERAHSTNPNNELRNQPAETTSDSFASLDGVSLWDSHPQPHGDSPLQQHSPLAQLSLSCRLPAAKWKSVQNTPGPNTAHWGSNESVSLFKIRHCYSHIPKAFQINIQGSEEYLNPKGERGTKHVIHEREKLGACM